MTGYFYETPRGERWHHRLVRWFRRSFNRPRFYVAIDFGHGDDLTAVARLRRDPDGTVTVIKSDTYRRHDRSH